MNNLNENHPGIERRKLLYFGEVLFIAKDSEVVIDQPLILLETLVVEGKLVINGPGQIAMRPGSLLWMLFGSRLEMWKGSLLWMAPGSRLHMWKGSLLWMEGGSLLEMRSGSRFWMQDGSRLEMDEKLKRTLIDRGQIKEKHENDNA